MVNVKDFTRDPIIPLYLKKISLLEDKNLKKFFEIYDKIDNMSQFSVEIDRIILEISDKKEQNSVASEFNVLKYLIGMMVVENIKNEDIDEFFGDAVDTNSNFSKYFKSKFNEEFIKKNNELADMDKILNKNKFSILDLDYDINLRPQDMELKKKPFPVISFHFNGRHGVIDADCNMKDIDYLIEELNRLKERGVQLEKLNEQ